MKKIVEIGHDILRDYISSDSVAVDFTMGNGFDTLFLSQNCNHVYAFDIQLSAILQTSDLLESYNCENVTLIYGSHEFAHRFIYQGFDVGVFNFGYLPSNNKIVTTLLESSIEAVEVALRYLRKGGVLLLVLYPGHDEGYKESQYFDKTLAKLNSKTYKVLQVKMWNQKDAPYIYAIEKR